jgi:pyruvate kinase
MNNDQQTPHNPHFSRLKKTKIIATVGPSTHDYEAILGMIKAGANGLRLNFSHGIHEEKRQQIKWIRKASKQYKKPVAVIQDLQGPKIRLGDFEGVIPVQKGQSLTFKYKADYERTGHLPTQYDLSKKVKRGERIFLYDGKIKTTVTSVRSGIVHVHVENDGILIKRKGMNLPETDFGGDIITAKDKRDIAFASTNDIDYVALSFVQTADDIRGLRKMLRNLGSDAKVIAKIETPAALENIEDIVIEADAVMIARGDLAIETPAESVPVMQRKIIGLGQLYATPTIVATQMMASMTESPDPTRAEVSDVATAVMFAADCVMLSDETANGKHPIGSVKMMKRVIRYTENHSPLHVTYDRQQGDYTKQSAICHSIIELAERVHATAIVAETKSGATALQIASRRPNIPIISISSDNRVIQQLSICFGTKNYLHADSKHATVKLTNWLKTNNVLNEGDIIVSAAGQHPGVVGTTDTIKVRVL